MAESRDRSSSTEPQLKFPGCSHYRRRSDNFRCQQCRLNEGLTLCTQKASCDVCKDWMPEARQVLENAIQEKQKRKVAAAAKAAKKSQEMDGSIEIHAPEDGLQVPPVKHRDDGSSKKLEMTKRADSATSLASRAMEADSADWPSRSGDKKKTLSSNVSVVGRSRSDGSPVPSGTKGSEHYRSRSGDWNRWSHGSERRHNSPRSRHLPRQCRSGERAQPTSSSGGSSSRARHADSVDAPGQAMLRGWQWRSSLLVLPLVISVITRGRRGIIGPCQVRSLGCPTCPEVRFSCPRSFHWHMWGEPSQWSRRLPDQQGWTSRQVWRARQTWQLWPTQQVWQARRTKQRYGTRKVTSQQGITTQQQLTSPRVWTTRQVLLTWHRNRTWQVHSHRNLQWTAQHIHRIQQWMT